MIHHRTGLIASGILFGLSAAMAVSGGILYGMDRDEPSEFGGLMAMTVGGALTGISAFPLIYFAREYSIQKSLLSQVSTEPAATISVAPILSVNLYGAGISGTF